MAFLKIVTLWKNQLILCWSSKNSWFGLLIVAFAMQGCQPLQELKFTSTTPLPFGSCNTIPFSINHELNTGSTPWERIIELPAVGKFVEESHYVTIEDKFGGQQWPNKKGDQIQAHLKRSFQAYRAYDPTVKFSDLYSQTWQTEWTPEEGGHFGQGAVGEIQRSELSIAKEMWFLTMMWAKEIN